MKKPFPLNKYSTLRLKNVYQDEMVDYTFVLSQLPDGWRIAFGDKLVEDLFYALNGEQLDILQIKEKFGGLRFYVGSASEAVYKVIDKYEAISVTTCIKCGDNATKLSLGWISPFCDKCADELNESLPKLLKTEFVSIEERNGRIGKK